MTEDSLDGKHERPRLSLYEAFGTLRPVRRPFALISEAEAAGTDVREWTTTRTSERIITFKGGAAIEERHDKLMSNGVSLLAKRSFGRDTVLSVPMGTRNMRTIASFVERDPDHYSVLFRLLGSELRVLYENNLGLPSGSWLDQFTYCPDPLTELGARVVFLPPYGTRDTSPDVMAEIGKQLAHATGLSELMTENLTQEIYDGWERSS
jgi:hypothetical protein